MQEVIDLKSNERPDGSPVFPTGDIRNPEVFEVMAKLVEAKHFKNRGLTTVDLPKYVEYLQHFFEFRFDENSVHIVNRNQEPFIKTYGEKVIPQLKWNK